VPSNGNWNITDNCILAQSALIGGNVQVQNNSVLEIPAGVTLTISSGNNITIESGSGVLIKPTGSLKVNS